MFTAALKFIRSTTVTLVAMAFIFIAMRDSNAQDGLRIAAIVNDEMISVLDIESRLTLSIYLSKLDNNLETRRRLAPQILRNIIDDRLKLQEIRKHKIAVILVRRTIFYGFPNTIGAGKKSNSENMF